MTNQPLSKNERELYSQTLASRLGIEPVKLDLRLIEIPTTSSEFIARIQKQAQERIQSEADKIFTEKQETLTVQMREHSLLGIKDYFKGFELPTPAEFADYEINLNGDGIPQVRIIYLSSQEIDGNRQISIADDIQERIKDPSAKIRFERIEPLAGTINFDGNQAKLSAAAAALLDRVGQIIQQNPQLRVEINAGKDENETEAIIGERTLIIADYLTANWQLASDRIKIEPAADLKRGATMRIKLNEKKPNAEK